MLQAQWIPTRGRPEGRARTRHATHRGPQGGLVVLSAGWSGERVLARLLAAERAVRVAGYALDRPVRDPAGRLRRVLEGPDGRLTGAFVMPHHLWLTNDLDADTFADALLADGITLLSLARRRSTDRGVSRSLCGPVSEVLPTAPRALDAGDVVLYGQECGFALEWFERVCPEPLHRIVFEDDLADPAGRQELVARLSALLDVRPWDAPPERELPDHRALWAKVANADDLRRDLEQLRVPTDG